MMPRWERMLYAAAMVAAPLLALVESRISAAVLTHDYDGDAGTVAMLQAIHAADEIWVVDCFVALALGLALVAGAIGLVKLTRPGAPRLSIATAIVLVVGAVGVCMHAVFWNIVHGAMSRTTNLLAMVDFLDQTESYPPFNAALVTVIVFADAGLILAAVTLWRSRTVPWWAALCALAFPVNDQLGSQGWLYAGACVLWVLGWGVAAVALVRGRPPTTDSKPRPETAEELTPSAPRQHR